MSTLGQCRCCHRRQPPELLRSDAISPRGRGHDAPAARRADDCMTLFNSRDFFPDQLLARLTDLRVTDPEFSWRAAKARELRSTLAPHGKLNLLAADHPARNVTRVGDEPLAMADRRDYLARIVRVLQSSRVDGVMATMDILEDLLAIDGLLRAKGAPSLLDGRVLIA